MTGREIGRLTTAIDRAAERRQALRGRELGCRQVRAIMEEFDPEYEAPNGLGWSLCEGLSPYRPKRFSIASRT